MGRNVMQEKILGKENERVEQQGRNGEDDIGMKIKNQEGPELTQGKDTRARWKIENKNRLILCHWMAKKYMYEKLFSEVACGLVSAFKLREKMNTDRERRTEERKRKNKTNVRPVLSQNLKPTLSSHTTQTGALLKT